MTYFADADGCTVHAVPRVYTGVGQAVCDAMILRCPTDVGLVRSWTILIWKFRYSLARISESPWKRECAPDPADDVFTNSVSDSFGDILKVFASITVA